MSKHTIEEELLLHIIETLNERYSEEDTNFEDLHYYAFNEDYYITYHYKAIAWLKKHDVDAFHAIDTVINYELDNFGSTHTDISPELIVNMYVYLVGEELLNNICSSIDLYATSKIEILASICEKYPHQTALYLSSKKEQKND